MSAHSGKPNEHSKGGKHDKPGKGGHDRAGEGPTGGFVAANPLVVVAGGLAAGAIAGALIPRSKKEQDLLAPIGRQLSHRARNAFAAAKQAGNAELEDLGISRSAARAQARTLVDGLGQALSSAGQAAARSAANGPD